ncbi:MAG: hypothetical protein GY874_08560 [Desulfobacteraceae bacterium]|nr:hypothetical protein [Desulfobacteraceae bacterium]
MHLYWRIQQDLNCMGEQIYFHDPVMIRALKLWVHKNITGLTLAAEIFDEKSVQPSLN